MGEDKRREGGKAGGLEGEGWKAEGLEGPEAGKVEGLDGDDTEIFQRPAAAELKAILEALIFASPDPLTPKAIFKLLDTEPQEDIEAALAE
jgi:hypothetical protein